MILYETRATKFSFSTLKKLEYIPHVHKEIELIYVHKGSLNLTCNFEKYTLNDGEFFIAFPHTMHEYTGNKPMEAGMWIFDSMYIPEFSSIFKKYSVTNPIIKIDNPDVSYAIKQFMERRELREDNLISRSFLTIILSNIVENIQKNRVTTEEQTEWLSELLKFVIDNYTKKITLDIVAKNISVSKYHISRNFKQSIGISFTDYINTLRANHALNLLATSERSITEIAFESGFESLTTFFRVFRDLKLKTPKNYKNDKF